MLKPETGRAIGFFEVTTFVGILLFFYFKCDNAMTPICYVGYLKFSLYSVLVGYTLFLDIQAG